MLLVAVWAGDNPAPMGKTLMMRIFTFVPCLLLVLQLATAAPAQDWAEKMFDSLEHDFGSVAKDSLAEHRFRITNSYKEEMRIASVSASCGCTTPTVTRKVIPSGETAELIARYNTDKFVGERSATLTVRFAPPFAAEVRVQVRGYIRQDVVLDPGRVEFGSFDAATGAQQRVRITYAGRNDWKVTDIRSANEHFAAELRPVSRQAGRVAYDLVLRVKPGAPAGYINEHLTLVTNDRNRGSVSLAVEGRVVPSISISPASIALGVVRPGESVTRQIVVRGKSPFKIARIECESGDPGFVFSPGDEARTLHLVPVTFTAGEDAGKVVERIRVVLAESDVVLPAVVAQVEIQPVP